jgi:hypothetical protein
MPELRNLYELFVGKHEGKRPLWKPDEGERVIELHFIE